MGFEIERKFLVKGDFKTHSFQKNRIVQGYLSSVAKRVVRVRLKDDKAYLTVKRTVGGSEFTRYEWEQEIPLIDGADMLKFCEPSVIEKIRYLIKNGNHIFEVDEFLGDNQGLILAEIELGAEDETFEKPDWLGEEVTQDIRYYNSYLSKHPYKKWEKG